MRESLLPPNPEMNVNPIRRSSIIKKTLKIMMLMPTD